MKKIKVIILIFFIFISCDDYSNSEYGYRAKGEKFIKEIAKEFDKRDNMFLKIYGVNTCGTIKDSPVNKIRYLDMGFGSFEKLNVEEARKFIVNHIEEVINKVNNDEAIRPYLLNYPFTYKNISLFLSFCDRYGNTLTDNCVSFCSLYDKSIGYNIEHSEGSFERIYEEPYEEALNIVKNNIKTDIPLKPEKSKRFYYPKLDESEEVIPNVYKIEP